MLNILVIGLIAIRLTVLISLQLASILPYNEITCAILPSYIL